MKTRRLLAFAAAAQLVMPSFAHAQASSETQAVTAAAAAAQAEAGAALMSDGSPNDRAMAGFLKPNLTFSADEDETTASLAFSFDLHDYAPQRTHDGFYRVSRTKFSIIGTVPIEEDDDKISALFAGDSLVDGAKVKFAFSNLSNSLGNARGAERFLPPAYDACFREQAADWLKTHNAPGLTPDGYVQTIVSEAQQRNTLRELRLEDRAEANGADSVDHFVYVQCFPGEEGHRYADTGELVDAYTELGDEYTALFYDRTSWMRFWGVDASVGRDNYTYLDRALFDTTDVSKTSWEVAAYFGVINWNATVSARVRGVYGRTYKLPDEAEVCHAVAGSTDPHCAKGPDGPPVGSDEGILSFEGRALLSLDEKTQIAIAPQVAYRTEDDSLGIEVPVYLAPDKDAKLSGGLKFAYNSKDDEFGVGVFVGIPFSIFFD